MNSDQPAAAAKPRGRMRVVGGIFRSIPADPSQPIRYAMVQGRQSGIWSFPKGHAKRGETVEETARREIEEETGWTTLPPLTGTRRVASVRYYLYDVYDVPPPPILPRDRKEVKDARWMSRDELQTVPVNRGVIEYLKL